MARFFNGAEEINTTAFTLPVVVPDNTPVAMSCWVNFGTGAFAAVQTFIATGFDGRTGYSLQADTSGGLAWGCFDGSVSHGVSWAGALSTSLWYQVYGDYTGAGGSPASTWRLYVGGSQVATQFDTVGPIQIGGRDFSAGAVNTAAGPTYVQYLYGALSDIAVWNGPLTPTEITNLSNGLVRPGLGMSKTLLGYWPIDGSSPEPDLSGNGQHMTVHGTTIVADPPALTTTAGAISRRALVGIGT